MKQFFCKPVFYRDVMWCVALIITLAAAIFIPSDIGEYLLQNDELELELCNNPHGNSEPCTTTDEWVVGAAIIFACYVAIAGLYWVGITAYKRYWIPAERCK